MDDFELELRIGFLEEASQLLNDVEQSYLALEANPSDATIIDQIFRVAHNLKGSAKAVGFAEMGAFAHEFENLLLKIKNNEVIPTAETVNLLLECNDHIKHMVETLQSNIEATFDSSNLLGKLALALGGKAATPASQPPTEELPSIDSIDISAIDTENISIEDVSQLKAVADKFEEFEAIVIHPEEPAFATNQAPSLESTANHLKATDPLSTTPSTQHFEEKPQLKVVENQTAPTAAPPPAAKAASAKPAKSEGAKAPVVEESIRVSLQRLEKLLNFVGEIVILQTVLKEQTAGSNVIIKKTVDQLEKVTKEVQDISMSLRMVPLKQTFQKMQRIVRDTSAALGKKVNLVLEGEETEVDKTVLEHLSDPLVHIIRNACDHGIESPEKRHASGKGDTGTLILRAFHQSGKLVIEIKDDGGGINPDILRAKATEKGILKPNANISDKDAINLIFHPGFSTKAQVTDVSGRGVGMDVVKTNIESLQGEVVVESEVGKGSVFKIYLPLTLAIIDAMLVNSENDRFVIPLAHVHESLKVQASELKYATGLGEILLLRGEPLPAFKLAELMGKRTQKSTADLIAIVVRNGPQPFVALVDDIIGQHQVVIKKLGDELQNIKGFSGSAILGDGKPALILELADLVQKFKPVAKPELRGVAA